MHPYQEGTILQLEREGEEQGKQSFQLEIIAATTVKAQNSVGGIACQSPGSAGYGHVM